MGEKQTKPFQFGFNGFLKVDFQGSRVTSDGGLILVRELDEHFAERRTTKVRNQGRLRLGYFPLPLKEAQRIRARLLYPASSFSAIDPCIGDGAAFLMITGDTCARRYGIELDAYRAGQAATVVDEVIQGSCLDVHYPVESFGLLFLNSPYDWTIGESRNDRTERVFLAHTYRSGGVLILVVPAEHVRECRDILASQFKDTRVYRLTEPDAVRYRQVVVLATRRCTRFRRAALSSWNVAAFRWMRSRICFHDPQLTAKQAESSSPHHPLSRGVR